MSKTNEQISKGLQKQSEDDHKPVDHLIETEEGRHMADGLDALIDMFEQFGEAMQEVKKSIRKAFTGSEPPVSENINVNDKVIANINANVSKSILSNLKIKPTKVRQPKTERWHHPRDTLSR